ncbi:MAG: Phospholipid methyltransferase [Ignavibacteriaceae bacterium]|nr:Phospholipid methyltransferase [Ignavibacteriaceae bacterium]
MNNQMFLLLVSLCIITHIVRFIYEILKHKRLIKASRFSFIIIFSNMLLLWTSWFLLCSIDPSATNLPLILRYLGISLVIIGVIIFLTALFTIKTLETYEGNLITSGIYSRIRHPMYLGFLFWLIGFPLFYDGIYSIILAIPFATNVLFWRHLEELELDKRFAAYKLYKKKTFF